MYNNLKESVNAINEITDGINARIESSRQRRIDEENDMRYDRDAYMEVARFNNDKDRAYKEHVTEKLLNMALNSIYISALEQTVDMDEKDYALAERMTRNYISENGAYSILRKMSGKTYLLDTLKKIVEDAAEEAEDNADDTDKETGEVSGEVKDDMFNKLENEDDVNDAVEVISNRIAAAEEEFIKKNAEDKKKIEDIVNDINERIQAVKDDVTKDEETKEDIEEAYELDKKRKVNFIYENRTHTIFDHMIHETAKSICKDTNLKELYSESGILDISAVATTCKVMYGFLEFVNTLQLDKVDKDYIAKVIKEF